MRKIEFEATLAAALAGGQQAVFPVEPVQVDKDLSTLARAIGVLALDKGGAPIFPPDLRDIPPCF